MEFFQSVRKKAPHKESLTVLRRFPRKSNVFSRIAPTKLISVESLTAGLAKRKGMYYNDRAIQSRKEIWALKTRKEC